VIDAAADVSPEALISGKVSYGTVRLTGELTGELVRENHGFDVVNEGLQN
jgi:hypothetical protein